MRGLAEGDLQAGRRLGLHYKRRRDWQRAAAVWERMAEAAIRISLSSLRSTRSIAFAGPNAPLPGWIRPGRTCCGRAATTPRGAA